MNAPARSHPPLALAFAVWGLGAALYCVGFFHRVAPAVITRELVAEFDLTAAALGNLSALYFYSYVAMQVPTGMLVDRYGPRRILAIGAAGAAAGGLLFAGTDTLALVSAGRLLVGASVGVAFVAMIKLSTHWFHPSRFALIAGLALGTGLVGAVGAGAPLRWLANAYGWRPAVLAVAGATAAITAAIWLVVRDDPAARGYASYASRPHGTGHARSMLGGLAQVLRNGNVPLICFMNGGVTAPVLTFGGLWGVPFLVAHYGLSAAAAAGFCSLLMVAWGIGGPLLGALSDRLRNRKGCYLVATASAALAWATLLMVPALPLPVMAALLALAGLASGALMIGFAYAKESAPPALAGTTGGVVNMGGMIAPMLMQPAVGWVLDRSWDGSLAEGVRVYSFAAYRWGFALMLAWLVAAVAAAAITRETHCRQLP